MRHEERRNEHVRQCRRSVPEEVGLILCYGYSANLNLQDMLPGTVADKIIHYNSRCYSGQFSDDGNFFFSCAQDFNVRMYDTSNPYDWKYYKTVRYPFGQWTITDATLSPDNRFLAYSSIRHMVSLASTDPLDKSDPTMLDFSVASPEASRSGFPHDWDMGVSFPSIEERKSCREYLHQKLISIDMVPPFLWGRSRNSCWHK